jgi:hypothetical protein
VCVCVCVCVCWVVFHVFFLGWECVQAPHLMAEQPSADEVLDRALTSDFGDFGFSREKQAARGVKVGGGGGGRHALVGGGGARFPHPQDPIIKSLEGAFDMSGLGEVGGVAKSLKVSQTLHPINLKPNIWPSLFFFFCLSVSSLVADSSPLHAPRRTVVLHVRSTRLR